MGCKVETKTGELIKAETSYASAYGARMRGYIQGFKGECSVSFTGGGTIYVDSGLIIWDGKNIIIDDSGLEAKLAPETGPDKTYYVFLVVDMKSGDGKLAVEDSTNPPGFVQDDLFLNYADGVCWILIGNVINTDSGLNGSETTIKPLTGAEKLFEGEAAIGNTIDLKYSIETLMSAKHIDLKLELLNIKLQGIVAYNDKSIFFTASYPTPKGSNAGAGIAMCELQLIDDTLWRVERTLITYTNGTNNVEDRKVEQVDIQF